VGTVDRPLMFRCCEWQTIVNLCLCRRRKTNARNCTCTNTFKIGRAYGVGMGAIAARELGFDPLPTGAVYSPTVFRSQHCLRIL